MLILSIKAYKDVEVILNEPNPYRPGAGRVPPLLAGREQLMAQFAGLLRQAATTGDGERPWLIYGLRGVGKTVIINQLAVMAAEAGWPVVKVEAQTGKSLATRLTQDLYIALRKLSAVSRGKDAILRVLSVFKSFQIRVDPAGSYTFGFDVEPATGVADSGNLAVDLTELLQALGLAARAEGLGLFIAVDELQEAPRQDLNALNVALHQLGQEVHPVPVVFVGAGLPSLPAVMAEATSYAERLYLVEEIGLLTEGQTRQALSVPATKARVHWSEEALELVVAEASGYPYFVQACGKYCWDVAPARTISEADAAIGVQRARAEVDQGLYRSRWDRANASQQEFMEAMVPDGSGPSAVGEVARRLGKKLTALSPVRSQLIGSGLIYSPRRGEVAFTVPGMDQYIERQKRKTARAEILTAEKVPTHPKEVNSSRAEGKQ